MDGYKAAMEQVRQLLLGNYKTVADEMRAQMLAAGEALNFELAATLRDRLRAVETLGTKQLVTAGKAVDTDVVGYGATETKACFAVLHFRDGNLVDKDYEIFPAAEDKEQVVSSLVSQYYISRGYAPKTILLPFEMEDSGLLSGVLEENYGRKTVIRVPQRGDAVKLVALAVKNAQEEAERLTNKEDRTNATLQLLGKMLCMDAPRRIESYDISNLSGTDIVAGMVVFDGGVPRRGDYKRFKIEGLSNADDYASMEQVLIRRFGHFLHGDKGFDEKPDLLLIDGGVTHAQTAQRVLDRIGLNFRILGMVKDDRHRTRALVTPGGEEIRIDNNPAIFALIGNIQEETHRFAISYHKKLRSKRLRYSALDAIAGIGPKRKELLLKTFKSLSGIKAAKLPELEQYLPKDAAMAVYEYFHGMKG